MSATEDVMRQGLTAEQAAAMLDGSEQPDGAGAAQEAARQEERGSAQPDESQAEPEEKAKSEQAKEDETESESGKEEGEEETSEESVEQYAETWEEVCEATGTDLDYWYSMKVNVPRMDGESEALTLEELKDREAQRGYDANWRSRLNEERAQQTQELAGLREKYTAQLDSAGDLLEQLRGYVTNGALTDAEKAQVSQQLDSFQEKAQREREKAEQAQAQEVEEARKRYVLDQQQRLLTELPEWSKAEVANQEWAQIADYLLSRGFTQEELGKLYDHRLMLVARDAMLARGAKSEGKEKALKKLKAAKVITLKPGERPAPEKVNRRRREASLKDLNKNPHGASIEEAAAFLDGALD